MQVGISQPWLALPLPAARLVPKPRQQPSRQTQRQQNCQLQAQPGAPQPLQLAKLFVPDITPGAAPGMSEAAFARLRAETIAMPVWELGLRAGLEIALLLIGWQVLRRAVKGLSRRGQQAIKQQIEDGDMSFSTLRVVSDAAVVAVQRPAKYFIPIVALANILRTATLALQIVAESDLLVRLHWIAKGAVANLVKVLGKADAKLIDCSEAGIIIFLTWFFLSWKQELSEVAIVMERKLKEKGQSEGGLERAVRPFSSLLGWAIIACGGLSVLHVMNVNIQPLLAVGGVGGLAVGFGAQVVTANALSGINLFLTRPFVVGDRITLKTAGGGVIIAGVVEGISPMRTVIRTDDNVPEGIPNKAITDCIVCNESSPRKAGSSALLSKDPRKYRHTFTLKLEDLDKLDTVRADLRAFLQAHPNVDRTQPLSVDLTHFSGSNFDIGIEAHTKATQTQDFSAFHSDMITQVARTFQRHSAEAA